jgi:hypothetical protein
MRINGKMEIKVNKVIEKLIPELEARGWTPPPPDHDQPDILDEVWEVQIEYNEPCVVRNQAETILAIRRGATDAQMRLMAAAPEMAKDLEHLLRLHLLNTPHEATTYDILRKAGVIDSKFKTFT